MLSSPLARAQQLLAQRLVDLEPLLGAGGVDNINAAWSAYAEAAAALAVVAQAAPGAPENSSRRKSSVSASVCPPGRFAGG